MEVCDHLSVDLADVVYVTQNWLSHHVISEAVEIDVFHKCFFWVLIHGFQFLPNGVFFKFQMIAIVDTVAKHVSKDFN